MCSYRNEIGNEMNIAQTIKNECGDDYQAAMNSAHALGKNQGAEYLLGCQSTENYLFKDGSKLKFLMVWSAISKITVL